MKRFSATPDVSDEDSYSSFSDVKKKRRSRWADAESDKNIIAGLPTTVPPGLTKEQEEQYLLQLQIEEITRRLRTGELGIPPNPADRSPSPEPMYNQEGKRLNTREFRTRRKLEEERHHLIQKVLKLNADYKPPQDYRPPLIRVSDRVNIPQEEHPEINFVGLLIGPRGNTLRNIEKETGTTIIIRGKGSVKEGKVGYKDGRPLPAQDEPLHAYITANNPENVKKAVDKIKQIIEEGINVPDEDNDLRKQQLRELALLNGTLRENDALTKLKQFQEAQTIITNTIVCTICGGAGHIAQDCKQKRPSVGLQPAIAAAAAPLPDKAKMDTEYMSLMAELGQGPPPPKNDGKSGSFSPALPMLGASRPMLGLPAPNGTGDQSSSISSAAASSNPPSLMSTGFSRPPMNLPPPRVPVPHPAWNPAPVPPPPMPDGSRMQMGYNPCMPPNGPPPPSAMGNQSSQQSAMLPPPPPPPFCAQPIPPPWHQPGPGLRPVPPPPMMSGGQSGWMPGPPSAVGGPVPPPSYPPWQQHHSSMSSSSTTSTNRNGASSGAFSLPSNISSLPPPPPPPV